MSNKGFGILQAIVVVGMITASGLYLFSQTQNAQKEIKTSLYRQEVLIFIDRLQDTLADSRACNLVLGNKIFGQEIIGAEDSQSGVIIQKGAQIGSTGAFILDRITLERHSGAFAKIRLHIALKENYRKGVVAPETFTRDIPVFAQIAGNTVVDCYYDPGDDDYNDAYPNGVISRAIRRVCSSPEGENLVGASVNNLTMKCNVPGFNPDSLPQINQNTHVASGIIPTGAESQISFLSKINQYWLPGKNCGDGFLEAVLPSGGVKCRSVEIEDIESSISTDSKNCIGKGFSLKRINQTQLGPECL